MSSVIDEYNDYGGEKDVTESVKVRLYPTEEQKSKINQTLAIEVLFGTKCLEK